MAIEPATRPTSLIRERGWTHWHHLFTPRQLLLYAELSQRHVTPRARACNDLSDDQHASARLTHWSTGDGDGTQWRHQSNVLRQPGAQHLLQLRLSVASSCLLDPLDES